MPTTPLNLTPCLDAPFPQEPAPNGSKVRILIGGVSKGIWGVKVSGHWVGQSTAPSGTVVDAEIQDCLPPNPSTTTTYEYEGNPYRYKTIGGWECGAV